MKTPILGSSYVARKPNAADSRMVNLFPEIVPDGGNEPAFLSRCPGLVRISSATGTGVVRGLWYLGDSLYVVAGGTFYRLPISNLNTVTSSFAVVGTTLPVSMADNGTQIFIATDSGTSYVYTIASNTFTTLTAGVANFPGATSVCFIGGYFVVNKPNTQQVWASALYDGTTWNALSFASAEQSPDNVIGVIANHGELWVFGTNSIEVWYNAGNAGFPFAPIQGAFMETGCVSPYSIAKMDNTVFWLGIDARGFGVVYKAHGYIGERISTHAVEWKIQNDGNVPDQSGAIAYTYQMDGHSFYVLNFPNAANIATTWVYDAATEAWHERQSYTQGTGLQGRHYGNCYAFISSDYNGTANWTGIIGSYYGGLFRFDFNTFTDDSFSQSWLRSWRALPPGQNNMDRTSHHSLVLNCEMGSSVNATNPQVKLRWSDDGGVTWSNYHSTTFGSSGVTNLRCIWRRLGMTTKLRDRVYEISGSDVASITIMGAELIESPTDA